MALIHSVTEAAFVCAVGWLCWRYFRHLIIPSPLDNIPGPISRSFWSGNFGQLFDRHGWDFQNGLGAKYGGVAKLHGLFGTKHLFIFDPLALQLIFKEQYVYEEPTYIMKINELLHGLSVLSTIGEPHRKQRKMLLPVFSTVHLRNMLPIFYGVGHRLTDAIHAQVGDETVEVDLLNWLGRTAMELIGQAGLGCSFDPLVKEVPNEFLDIIKTLLPTILELHKYQQFLPFLTKIGTPAFRRRVVEMFPDQAVQRLKSAIDAMHVKTTHLLDLKKAMEQGDEAVLQQVGEGKDLISILMRANLAADGEDKLSDDELLAQVSAFIFAATDTTSNALARALHVLAKKPDIQDKLRAEVSNAFNGADVDYDVLVGLPYMDAVCRETLRLYAPVSSLSRETRKDSILHLSEPIVGVNGDMISEIHVPKDTEIVIGISACNRNKAIWGEGALEFKPERWITPLPKSVTDARIPGIYSNIMTFLGGRSCIGFTFAQLEMKVVLALLVQSFQFSLADKDIVWNICGVNYPTVGKESTKPQLPLMVSRVNTL